MAMLAAGCLRPSGAPACEGVAGASATRIVEHPGAGHEVTVRLRFADGVPIGEADLVRCLSVADPGGDTSRAAPVVSARPVTSAYTLLLVDPGSRGRDSENARTLTEQIVRRRPPGEAVALYRWGAEVTQVAPFVRGPERQLLLDRMAVGLPGADTLVPVRTALGATAAVLASIGGPSTDALRTIVLVAPRATALAALGDALPAAAPHLVMWLGAADQAATAAAGALPPGLRFPIPANTASSSVVATLSDRLDAYQRLGHYAIGVCGGDGEQGMQIEFRGAASTSVTLPRPMPEDLDGSCRPEALAAGRRQYPRRIELLFSAEQRDEAAAAYADRGARPPFGLSVRVHPGATPTAATARYRAGGAYACDRRSYTVELEGPQPRFLFPGSGARKFHLAAMCLDRLYLRSYTTLSLLAAEGLFPDPFDLVELVVDGVSQGPYLAFEDAADSLRMHSSRVASVMSRDGSGAFTAPEVQFAAIAPGEALASYQRILDLTDGLSGQRLENVLRDRLDFDHYLTWVALMSLLGSGGYEDQVVFFAVETTGPDGLRSDYHLMMGWDQPRPFEPCAGPSRGGLVDPYGLVACSAGELDRRIFVDPLLYGRYADHLEALLDRLTPARFAAFVEATALRLSPFFDQPEALAGLTELAALNPDATTHPEVARALLAQERELLSAQYEGRRAAVASALARYRAAR
jgi:hypothetical protein